MKDALLTENRADARIITFNRPEIRSPLSVFVLEQLIEIIADLPADSSVKTVIFTGRENVFASGADLREIAALTANGAVEFALRGQKLMKMIAALPQETVAAVNGFCFGGALDLALACRRRVAAPNAVFSHPGSNLGIVTGWGGTQRLPRLIGAARALEMFFTARRVTADEALKIGLIDLIDERPAEFSLANFAGETTS